MRAQELGDRVLQWLGPVAIAAFIDMGWIDGWPLGLTLRGQVAARNGYGRDLLPIEPGSHTFGDRWNFEVRTTLTVRPGGAYSWEGREPVAPWEKQRRIR